MSSNNLNYKNQNLTKLKFLSIVCFLFLLYFFSNNLIYAQTLQKDDTDYLIPIGNVLQIDAELKTLIVKSNTENSPFQLGDAIIKINNSPINGYNDFSKALYDLEPNNDVSVVVNRSGHQIILKANKDILERINLNNLLSGFATLTYINPDNNDFGAVGHPINIGTSKKVPIKNGSISTTTDINIQKSCKGNVGCINAKRKYTIGEFNENTSYGIKGKIINYDISNLKKYKIASLEEVKLGKAQIILQTGSYDCEKYDIEIISIEKQRHPDSKTFKIKIIDKDLLDKTGGIVQGMSGTPIVQGNKIVGAISHAVENDPSIGYGVYIKWMLENE